MAAAGLSTELTCAVCREIYTDPVTLPCGHNYCQDCIERTWGRQQEIKEDPSCPECRQTYRRRPKLNRNVTLSSLVQSFLPTAPEPDGPGIYCTYCKRRRVTACSTCLLCNVSLCYEHTRKHNKSTEHKLTAPTPNQSNRHCPKHPELLLEYYCPQDGVCVCASCYRVGEHRGHSVEPLNEETAEKKKEKLREVLEKLRPEREETEGQIQRLQERRREVAEKSVGETERITVIINDLIKHLKTLRRQIIGKISRKKKKHFVPLRDLIHQLEIKKDELSRKIRHIEELCNMADPLTVLQERESHGAEFCGADNKAIGRDDMKVPPVEDLDVILISEIIIQSLEGKVNEIKRSYCSRENPFLYLDGNTAHRQLKISNNSKTATYTPNNINANPETSLTFQTYTQVLSTISFHSGRHYWDVDCSKSGYCWVGVAYPSIERGGNKSYIGDNNKSWALHKQNNLVSVIHDKNTISLPINSFVYKLRVYLDYEAGRLHFYELSEPIRHLHTFSVTFTEPLHAAFWVREGSVTITE